MSRKKHRRSQWVAATHAAIEAQQIAAELIEEREAREALARQTATTTPERNPAP